jgi:hypothetical protein
VKVAEEDAQKILDDAAVIADRKIKEQHSQSLNYPN